MYKKTQKLKFIKIEKIFIIFFFIFLIYQFSSYILFTSELEVSENSGENCTYFLPFMVNNLGDFEVIKQAKDIYVLPEIKNVLCLGRVVSYELQENIIFAYIGTNSKFVNLLIFSSQLILITLYSFIFKKENYKIICSLMTIFIFIYYFESLNVISYFYFLFFPTIFFYSNKSINDTNIKLNKNIPLSMDIVFILFLFISFCVVQLSSHQYETIDWDINAYLVTSLDIGRGNLPLENQFENKPPLLFLIYYLFSLLAEGNLLPIKIYNDLILFLSIVVLYFIIKSNKNFRLEAFISSLLFILLTSNYWFHPGFSEIFSLFFLSLSYLNLIKSNNKYKFFISGLIFSLSTLVNIGSTIFLIGFSLIILIMVNQRFLQLIWFYFGLAIVHLFVFAFYFLNDLANEYLISVFFIPISYSQTKINIVSELIIFLTSLFEYNILICILLFATTANVVSILLRNLKLKNGFIRDSSTYTSILFLNSCLFYYSAAKGYYHHLFFILFFVTFGITKIPKGKYKSLVFIGVLVSSFQIFSTYLPQTITNLRHINELEENYPVNRVAKLVRNEIKNDDIIFSTDNILLLYYLDKPNASYIVHPALYEYEEISRVLEKYNKTQVNELMYQIGQKPNLIEGLTIDEVKNGYYKLDTENLLSENIDFFNRDKKIEIFLKKD